MDFVEKTGKTVDEAVTAALIELGVSSDQVNIEIVDEGTKGILGLFSKEAKVRVSLKSSDQGETVEKEIEEEVAKELEPIQSEIDSFSEGSDQADEPVGERNPEAIDKACEFLTNVLEAMGTQSHVKAEYSDDNILNVDIEGDGMGVIIGKRGNTLDSLQYLTTLVVNKGSESHVRVKLDTENYRERRQQTLESLAINLAKKVKKTGKRVILEPMNPYERRIIHSTLQSDPMIETHSEGEEPYRKVVISLKRKGGR